MKRELYLPLAAAAVAVLFLAVCAMVLLTRNHPTWVRRKLRVGALLLSLTAVVSCGDEAIATCYEPIVPNQFEVEQVYGGTVSVDLTQTQTLAGTIYQREGEAFSYQLTYSDSTELARDNIDALDGAYDENVEEFEITLPGTLIAGSYTLELFASDADAQPEYASATFTLEVSD